MQQYTKKNQIVANKNLNKLKNKKLIGREGGLM